MTRRLIGLMLAAASVAGCSGGARSGVAPAPRELPPSFPNIVAMLPARYQLTRATWVNLDGSGTPQLAVAAISHASIPHAAPSTVLLFAWNSTTKRWIMTFDASKQPRYQIILRRRGTERLAQTPRLALVHDQANGGADLLYSLGWKTTTSSAFLVGAVHYARQTANLAWSFSADESNALLLGRTGAAVDGTAPFERIKVTLPVVSQLDPRHTTVRTYSFVVAPNAKSPVDAYGVVSEDRPLVGVGLARVARSAEGRVTYIPAGSPAVGTLRLGDLIDGIDGISPLARPQLGPAVIDEVALHHPGDTVAFDIRREGKPIVVAMKLSQWNFALGEPGYSGVALGVLGVYARERGVSVVVTATVPGGPADTAGIAGGSTLAAVNGTPIHTIANLRAALPDATVGDTAMITYMTPNGPPTTTAVGFGPAPRTNPPMLFTL